jgi:hypothetical protein
VRHTKLAGASRPVRSTFWTHTPSMNVWWDAQANNGR